MTTVKHVARRIEHEVGLSRAVAVRIANKLNKLAKSVAWATPVEDGGPRGVVSHRVAISGRLAARPRLAAKRSRRAPKKKR